MKRIYILTDDWVVVGGMSQQGRGTYVYVENEEMLRHPDVIEELISGKIAVVEGPPWPNDWHWH
jgi:hypothetical protein